MVNFICLKLKKINIKNLIMIKMIQNNNTDTLYKEKIKQLKDK